MLEARKLEVSEFNLGPLDDLPSGEGRTFQIHEARVAVFRSRAGEIFATQAECTHRGGPLAEGTLGGRTLVCPLHGFKFDLPSGVPIGHSCSQLQTFEVDINENNDVILRVRTE